MIAELVYNIALLIALSTLYGLLTRFRKNKPYLYKILTGILFGIIAIAGMKLPFHYSPGVIYDGRSIIMVMAGLFGGGTTVILSTVIAGIYRAHLGGIGIWAGLCTIITCAVIGLIFRRVNNNQPENIGPLGLYGLGIITHIVMLSCQLLIPWPTGLVVINRIAPAIMLVFPGATLIMGILLRNAELRIINENSLKEKEASMRYAQIIAQMGSWEYDPATKKMLCSENMLSILGINHNRTVLTWDELVTFVHHEDLTGFKSFIEYLRVEKNPCNLEFRIILPDGQIKWLQNNIVPEFNYDILVQYKGVSIDISQRKHAEDQVKKELAEKEVLLKEIHHRVKNNLNIIVSLLNLQSSRIESKEDAHAAFKETRDRIFSMSLVHEKLYNSKDFSNIDMNSYIKSMTSHLRQAAYSMTPIKLELTIENIFLDINKAIPCGLIINELFTNAIKHAFQHKESGVITINFTQNDNHYNLQISDDGCGFSEQIIESENSTLGLQIVKLLTDQLDGNLKMKSDHGAFVEIQFPL